MFEAQQALDRAKDCLDDSEFNLSNGRTIVTVNRAYYCIFYCMNAALFTKEIYAKTHAGTQNKFSEYFIQTSIFPKEFSVFINDAFLRRQSGDYDMGSKISEEEAEKMLQNARIIYQFVNEYFQDLIKNQ